MALSKVEQKKIKEIYEDPVLWCQAFLKTQNNTTKQITPWIARWYQVGMLRDTSVKKVYRCGRRIGKTETMIAEALYHTNTKKNFRVLFVTPYENQVRLIFMRLREIIKESPLIDTQVETMTKNPYQIIFKNGSAILGFTTGASSGSGGASIRGQRADMLFLDEVDYMGDADFDAVTAIAVERRDIRICMSSTPTGKRSNFYKACTNPKMGYKEHYHPSTHNPGWCNEMEAEFRAQLSEQGYVHEVLAEFGTQETGVFNKEKLDLAMRYEYYNYNELDYYQLERVKMSNITPKSYIYKYGERAPMNPFRTMGIDWDKYGSSSSILILDYDVYNSKFKVIKRVEVPKAEYSYDKAIETIVELNEMYNPSYIYCDSGAGEYQIERLHIIGDERPSTGLKNKVKRCSFSSSIDVDDPITMDTIKHPFKEFMVNQLQIAFERERIILSPFDEVLHKQLVDYEVVKENSNGTHTYSSKDEHFVDALGLSYLAFVLEFPNLTDMIKKIETTTKFSFINKSAIGSKTDAFLEEVESKVSNAMDPEEKRILEYDKTELRGDRPFMYKVNSSSSKSGSGGASWGSRANSRMRNSGRSMW